MFYQTTMPRGSIDKIRTNLVKDIEEDKVQKQKNREQQKNNRYSKYYNKRWKSLRDLYINEHPLCENCMKYGLVSNATQVHHIIPFLTGKTENEKKSLLYNYYNLMSLCEDCHREMHRIAVQKGLDYINDCIPIKLQIK